MICLRVICLQIKTPPPRIGATAVAVPPNFAGCEQPAHLIRPITGPTGPTYWGGQTKSLPWEAKPWVRLNRSDGRSRVVFVAFVRGGSFQPVVIRSLTRVWRLLVPVNAFGYTGCDAMKRIAPALESLL